MQLNTKKPHTDMYYSSSEEKNNLEKQKTRDQKTRDQMTEIKKSEMKGLKSDVRTSKTEHQRQNIKGKNMQKKQQ